MERSLRRSARPFIAFGVIFGGVWLFCLYNYVSHGFPSDLLAPLWLIAGFYALQMAVVTSVRVTVKNDGIVIQRWHVSNQFISFSDIERSEVQVLAEPNWPVSITIRLRGGKSIGIGLKAIRQEDAMWLCSLPQLKSNLHPGRTKRA
jgi:hypothetical protein